jgi:PKD repeat protein
MKPKLLVSSVFVVLLLLPLVFASAQTPAQREYAPVQKGYVASGEKVQTFATDRILVKFTEASLENSKLNIGLQRGSAASGAQTGIASVDALGRQIGVVKVSRPFIELKNKEESTRLGVDRWYMIEVRQGTDIMNVVDRYAADPNVEHASPDWVAFPAAVPNDPLHPDHWGHNNTAQLLELDWGGTYEHIGPGTVGTPGFDSNAHGAWDVTYGSSSIVIAILDSGVDAGHPDLNQVAGYDYGDNDSNPDDNSAAPGHGTACAGVAASIANNGLGAAGIAGGCRIMPLKVANSAGSMYFSSIINAIYHAADNGADMISMSFSADISSDPSTDAAILYAYNAGVVLLAATSNSNQSHIHYPANNTYVVGVGAASPCGDRKRSSSLASECNPGVSTDPNGWTCDGERWWGSNYGTNSRDAAGAVDIIAPTILPTTDIQGSGGYASGNYSGFFNGTSCSTPYAAGVCALIKTQNPTWTPAQIRNQLVTTAIDIVNVESGSGWDRYSGYGMVDAEAAVGGGGGPVAPTAAFTGSPTSGDAPLTVNFTDQSSGEPTSWSWNFGDTGTSGAQNPNHTYTASGTYTVTLTATNAQGSDDEVKINYITVTEPGSGYANLPYSTGFEGGSFDQYWTTNSTGDGRVRLLTSNTPHSGSYHMTMDDPSSGGYTQNEGWLHLNLAGEGDVDLDFWWKDFSDETHTQDGVFFSDNGGSSFTKVLDLPGASYTNNSWSSWSIDVDQAAASAGLNLTSQFVVKFQQYDNYPIATDGMAFDDISVTTQAPQPPVADFTGTPTSGTAPLSVQFTDASTGATSWDWNFGDTGTSTAQNPNHTYNDPGNYTVTLTATNAVGSDVETKTNYITVSDPGSGQWNVITYDDFEGGWGNFVDGGSDCRRSANDARYAHQGTYCARIRDNTSTSIFYHGSSHNVTAYTDLEVEFWYYPRSMENNEDFWLQYYNGSSWQTVGSWAAGTDFSNGSFYHEVVSIPSGTYNYPTNAQIRFRCDASGNSDYIYIDEVEFRGFGVGGAGGGIEVANKNPLIPEGSTLSQNYPNPFNPRTTISFNLLTESHVTLEVFNVAGKRVATLVDGHKDAGLHSVDFDASSMSSGIYFYRITTGSISEFKKMILLK